MVLAFLVCVCLSAVATGLLSLTAYRLSCLIYEMLFIKELQETLNTQSDSIRAKLFL